jgi:hypothetical protein
VVTFRVSSPDYKQLRRWADEQNFDVSELMRRLIEQEAARRAPVATVTEQAA